MQEEIRRGTRDGSSSKNEDEENFALAAKPRKWKGNKHPSKSDAKGKKQDLSKLKCFRYHEHGNFTTNFPQKKKNKKVTGAAAGEALASQFELDFSFITCLVFVGVPMFWQVW